MIFLSTRILILTLHRFGMSDSIPLPAACSKFFATVGALGAIGFIILFLIGYSLSFLTLIKTNDSEVNPILLGLFSSLFPSVYLAYYSLSIVQ